MKYKLERVPLIPVLWRLKQETCLFVPYLDSYQLSETLSKNKMQKTKAKKE